MYPIEKIIALAKKRRKIDCKVKWKPKWEVKMNPKPRFFKIVRILEEKTENGIAYQYIEWDVT